MRHQSGVDVDGEELELEPLREELRREGHGLVDLGRLEVESGDRYVEPELEEDGGLPLAQVTPGLAIQVEEDRL